MRDSIGDVWQQLWEECTVGLLIGIILFFFVLACGVIIGFMHL